GGARKGTQRHSRLGRATGRGRRHGRRADDQCRRGRDEDARRRGGEREPAEGSDAERAGRRGRLLCGAEGGGVSMSELTKLTLAGARDALRKKEISSAELTGAYLAEMEAGAALNAYVTATGEKALEMAK